MIRLCSVGCLLHSLEPWPPCPPETSSGRSGNPVEICGEKELELIVAIFSATGNNISVPGELEIVGSVLIEASIEVNLKGRCPGESERLCETQWKCEVE